MRQVIFLAVAAPALVTVFIGCGTRRPALDFPVAIDLESLELGEVWVQDALIIRVPVQNTSKREVAVTKIVPGCKCMSISSDHRLHLKPGESSTLVVNLDLRPREGSAEAQHSFRVSFALVLSDNSTKSWDIRATVLSVFSGLPRYVEVGHELSVGAQVPPVKWRVETFEELERLNGHSAHGAVNVVRVSANVYDVQFALDTSRIEPGSFQVPVKLTPAKNGLSLPSVSVDVMGLLQHDVTVTPNTLYFGLISTGTTRCESVLIRSRSGVPFTTRATIPEEERSFIEIVSMGQPDSSKERVFVIQVTPTTPGRFESIVAIEVDRPDDRYVLPITIRGEAISQASPVRLNEKETPHKDVNSLSRNVFGAEEFLACLIQIGEKDDDPHGLIEMLSEEAVARYTALRLEDYTSCVEKTQLGFPDGLTLEEVANLKEQLTAVGQVLERYRLTAPYAESDVADKEKFLADYYEAIQMSSPGRYFLLPRQRAKLVSQSLVGRKTQLLLQLGKIKWRVHLIRAGGSWKLDWSEKIFE